MSPSVVLVVVVPAAVAARRAFNARTLERERCPALIRVSKMFTAGQGVRGATFCLLCTCCIYGRESTRPNARLVLLLITALI